MRLANISERRGAQLETYFHGCGGRDLNSILNHGLRPSAWINDNSPIGQEGRELRAFLTSRLPYALAYGNHIIEVVLNVRDKEIGPDEDRIIPHIPPVTASHDDWAQFFSDHALPHSKQQELRYLVANNGRAATEVVDFVRRVAKLDRNRADSIMTSRVIGLRGRSRIVGAYEFGPYHRSLRSTTWSTTCVRIAYDNGGTIQLGQESAVDLSRGGREDNFQLEQDPSGDY